jgi:hypothetical protein
MKVVFIAADGDHDRDNNHRLAHWKYAHLYLSNLELGRAVSRGLERPRIGKPARELGVMPVPTLDQIVHFLVGQNAFVHWPLSDLLHNLKNMRQRTPESDGVGIALQAEAPTLYRADLSARTGVRGLETSGGAGAMID